MEINFYLYNNLESSQYPFIYKKKKKRRYLNAAETLFSEHENRIVTF